MLKIGNAPEYPFPNNRSIKKEPKAKKKAKTPYPIRVYNPVIWLYLL
jgi:hypothetical protein